MSVYQNPSRRNQASSVDPFQSFVNPSNLHFVWQVMPPGSLVIADEHSRMHVAAFLVRIVDNQVTGAKYAAVDYLLTLFLCHYFRQCLCLFALEHRFGQGGRPRHYLKADAFRLQTPANIVSAVVQIVPWCD